MKDKVLDFLLKNMETVKENLSRTWIIERRYLKINIRFEFKLLREINNKRSSQYTVRALVSYRMNV